MFLPKRLRLLYILLACLLAVGLLPVALAGWLLSGRSADELRSIEGRYQAQLVQDKARQIELFGRRYREVVSGLARAFELTGGIKALDEPGADARLEKALREDPNLIALSIEPVGGTPRRAFQVDVISREEVEECVSDVLAHVSERGTVIRRPRMIRSGQEIGITIAAPILGGESGEQVQAAIVAVISFREVFRAVQQPVAKTEKELLEAGLPVIFVVDQGGHAVAHPDERVAYTERAMTDLKIVQDWLESGDKVTSFLAPFQYERNGQKTKMLGSYGTAELGNDTRLGVIAIQDEGAALASVREMRWQTLMIILVSALLASIVGVILAKKLSEPVQALAEGARRLANGDFGQRIEINSRTELGELGDTFNLMTGQIEKFIKDLQASAKANHELFLGTVKALAAAIDGKDPYTRGHSERVSRVSVAIAQRLDLPDEEVEEIRISALLHDVGKIGIDDRILKKPGALTDDEFEVMKQHPQKGYRIMSQIPAMKSFLPGIYMHHEMLNGNGYPQGLKGDEISLQARIISVADAFDAMTIDRPYQKAMPFDKVLERIQSLVNSRYDDSVVKALLAACEDGQIMPGRVRLRQTRNAAAEAKLVASVTHFPLNSTPQIITKETPAG